MEINRIRKAYSRFGIKFLQRILSNEEIAIFFERNESISFLAGRFAAKEAISKSYGTGISEDLNFNYISVIPSSTGSPVVYINDKIASLTVSISHCKEYAMAVSILN